jgi:hypothetical protein
MQSGNALVYIYCFSENFFDLRSDGGRQRPIRAKDTFPAFGDSGNPSKSDSLASTVPQSLKNFQEKAGAPPATADVIAVPKMLPDDYYSPEEKANGHLPPATADAMPVPQMLPDEYYTPGGESLKREDVTKVMC